MSGVTVRIRVGVADGLGKGFGLDKVGVRVGDGLWFGLRVW